MLPAVVEAASGSHGVPVGVDAVWETDEIYLVRHFRQYEEGMTTG